MEGPDEASSPIAAKNQVIAWPRVTGQAPAPIGHTDLTEVVIQEALRRQEATPGGGATCPPLAEARPPASGRIGFEFDGPEISCVSCD